MRLCRLGGLLTWATLLAFVGTVWAQTPTFTGEIATGINQCMD